MTRAGWVLAASTALLAACVAAVGCRSITSPAVASGHDAAVVLLSGPDRLVTVDLAERRVVADATLRSLALDLDVDAATGLAVTAQCGGVGDAADDAIGLYDVRGGGPVAYVQLPRANPVTVACEGGRAFVQHGIVVRGGLALSVADLERRRVVRTGVMPDGPGSSMTSTGGVLTVLSSSDQATAALAVVRVRGSDLVTVSTSPCPPGTVWVGADRLGGLVLLGGGSSLRSAIPPWSVEADAAGRAGTVTPLPGIASLGRACATPRHAAVAEADEGGPETSSRVAIVDRAAGAAMPAIEVEGVVVGLGAWGERVVAVTRDPCRLVAIDPARSRVLFSVSLGSERVLGADVHVLMAPQRGAPVSGRASP